MGRKAFHSVPAVFQKGSGERSRDFSQDPSLSGAGDLTQGRTLETAKLITNCLEGNPPQKPRACKLFKTAGGMLA